MDDIRFENNLCANIGDGGWSAAQRPDPAGRSVCSYDNTAKTSGVSVVNNIFWETQGFEAMLYVFSLVFGFALSVTVCIGAGTCRTHGVLGRRAPSHSRTMRYIERQVRRRHNCLPLRTLHLGRQGYSASMLDVDWHWAVSSCVGVCQSYRQAPRSTLAGERSIASLCAWWETKRPTARPTSAPSWPSTVGKVHTASSPTQCLVASRPLSALCPSRRSRPRPRAWARRCWAPVS